MKLFGKSRGGIEVVTAELLPNQKQLFACAMDTDCNLHVFEYNPEGQCTGTSPSSTLLNFAQIPHLSPGNGFSTEAVSTQVTSQQP